jgi:hypothetical protein
MALALRACYCLVTLPSTDVVRGLGVLNSKCMLNTLDLRRPRIYANRRFARFRTSTFNTETKGGIANGASLSPRVKAASQIIPCNFVLA